MGRPAKSILESVLRDPSDRRRFYITYLTRALKREAMGMGMTFGTTVIPPTTEDCRGYIPYPPYFLDAATIHHALSQYGTVTRGSFVTQQEGIRVAGYNFEIVIDDGKTPPREIVHNDRRMEIKRGEGVQGKFDSGPGPLAV